MNYYYFTDGAADAALLLLAGRLLLRGIMFKSAQTSGAGIELAASPSAMCSLCLVTRAQLGRMKMNLRCRQPSKPAVALSQHNAGRTLSSQ
jgi:hypothetical protein